jgi:hypothetical protein
MKGQAFFLAFTPPASLSLIDDRAWWLVQGRTESLDLLVVSSSLLP